MVLETYLSYFLKLKRANGNAPHKPILLLSVFQAIQSGLIDNPFFKAEPELVSLYNSNFSLYVNTNHNPNFTLPFTKMNSEPFWKIIFKKEFENIDLKKTDIKSFVALNRMIFGVQIDIELFNILIDRETNEKICNFIVNKYFPQFDYKGYKSGYGVAFEDTINNMLTEPSVEYVIENKKLKEKNDEDSLAIRSAAFKRMIHTYYDSQCAITGWQLQISSNISMIDACHIKPFSDSFDDTIGNGIALCPNLHRAFDRGLISISEDYTVLVSKGISENHNMYSLRNLEGKSISKPIERKYWPHLINLEYHRDNVFVK